MRITAAIDIRRREYHWTTIAWKAGAIGYIIDYGFDVVHSPIGDLKDPVIKKEMGEAILTTLLGWKDELDASGGFVDKETGEMRSVDMVMVDRGWFPEAVHTFCRAVGKKYLPTWGYGTNSPAGKYRKPQNIKLPSGSNWHAVRSKSMRQIYYALDVDRLKQRVHDGFMIPENQNGSLSVFGDDPVRHRNYADHILREVWEREFVPGKGYKEGWRARHGRNHWLDTTAQNVAAAEILKISVLGQPALQKVKPKPRRIQRGGFLGNLPEIRT